MIGRLGDPTDSRASCVAAWLSRRDRRQQWPGCATQRRTRVWVPALRLIWIPRPPALYLYLLWESLGDSSHVCSFVCARRGVHGGMARQRPAAMGWVGVIFIK